MAHYPMIYTQMCVSVTRTMQPRNISVGYFRDISVGSLLSLSELNSVLTFSTEYFLNIFLLQESWEDRKRANGEFRRWDVGSDIFTSNDKFSALLQHITWYALGSLGPTTELTIGVKP